MITNYAELAEKRAEMAEYVKRENRLIMDIDSMGIELRELKVKKDALSVEIQAMAAAGIVEKE